MYGIGKCFEKRRAEDKHSWNTREFDLEKNRREDACDEEGIEGARGGLYTCEGAVR